MRLVAAGLVVGALLAGSPAVAAVWRVTAVGTTFPGVAGPLAGVPWQSQPVFAQFTINSTVGTPVALPTPGNIGTQTRHDGAVTDFVMQVGPWSVTRTANSFRPVFVIDNIRPNPNQPSLRLDQFSISEGFNFANGQFLRHLATDAPLAPDVFLASLNFGRSQSLPQGDPTFITGTGIPDVASVFANGPYFLSFSFRQGNPTNAAEFAALPFANFSTSIQFVNVELLSTDVIPEPASWAMLITGFGLTGAVLRRRRAAVA